MSLPYTKLNPSSRGNGNYAPHKPLLLLCLIDMAEAGELDSPHLDKTPGLRLRFDAYFAICQRRWKTAASLDLPFHYLSSQGFWVSKTKEGAPSRGPRSTHYVELAPAFMADIESRERRDAIRRQLVETWFPEPEQRALYAALGWSAAKLLQIEWATLPDDAMESAGRDASFRVQVITQYRFTCALTGYGCHTSKGHALVEAAHIHAFAKSRNNSPTNGLALTRDAHWMFDKGLWTLDADRRILVAKEIFAEWGPETEWLQARHQQRAIFNEGTSLRPDDRCIHWHRAHVFNRMAG
jgi:putative restriction endonuclease